jgi:peptidoglycan/LPS O-acetylase OafA/YrhL
LVSVCAYLIVLSIATCCFASSFWQFMDRATTEKARVSSIDGIRGYLAISVVIHHAVIARTWLSTGQWVLPQSPFFAQLGSVAVSLFFMITGFLFWGKLVGALGRIDWIRLYVGRVFRIAPIYFLAVTVVALLVFHRTGWQLRTPLSELLYGLGSWYALGLFTARDFNGYGGVWILFAGVTWTLMYEWMFYFALWPASLFARRKFHVFAALAFFGGSLSLSAIEHDVNWTYACLFASGMLSASIRCRWPRFRLPCFWSSLTTIGLLVILFASNSPIYGAKQAAMLAAIFFLVSNGATLFGLLSTNAAIRLGHASYAIYLLQGLVFSVVWNIPFVRALVMAGDVPFWLATVGSVLALAAACAVLYVWVEQPCIDFGRVVGARASNALRFAPRTATTAGTIERAVGESDWRNKS